MPHRAVIALKKILGTTAVVKTGPKHSTLPHRGAALPSRVAKLKRMRFVLTVPLLLALPLLARKAPKPPDVTIVEFSAKRSGELVEIEASVRNSGVKPIAEGIVIFHFYSPEHEPVTTQRAGLDERTLEPGGSSTIHAQLEDPVRAVTVEVDATDAAGHVFRVAAGGPFPID